MIKKITNMSNNLIKIYLSRLQYQYIALLVKETYYHISSSTKYSLTPFIIYTFSHIKWAFYMRKGVKIPIIEKNKLYVSWMHRPRYIIPDNFLIMSADVYIQVCNLYENMKRIINNDEIDIKMKSVNEKMVFNGEDILLASFFLCGHEVDDLVYLFK